MRVIIHPRKLKFLLDQKLEQKMAICGINTAVCGKWQSAVCGKWQKMAICGINTAVTNANKIPIRINSQGCQKVPRAESCFAESDILDYIDDKSS